MRCSSCGSPVEAGRQACEHCGARRRAGVAARTAADLPTCPRCGFHGESVSYFSRGLHAGLLFGAALLTIGVLGAGGLVYYLLRRDHQICARCGLDFGAPQERHLLTGGTPQAAEQDLFPSTGGEWIRRATGITLLALGLFLMVASFGAGELAGLALGALSTLGGALLVRAAGRARDERRRQIVGALQRPVLRLAAARGGRLTASTVAAELGWSLARSKKILDSLELSDALRVSSEVTDEGVIVYEFYELLDSPGQRSLPG
jgi:hypothetical protein